MFGSPGFSEPEHQYGQSFGDQAEVLGGGVDLSPLAVLGGMESGEVPDLGMEQADGEFGASWAGKGFSKQAQEPE